MYPKPFQITYQNKAIPVTNNVKFLGLVTDINISWKNHVYKILSKISSVCCLFRVMYLYSITTLKMIYFACFHAVMRYRVILWRNSVESKRVFQQQKRIIRSITN